MERDLISNSYTCNVLKAACDDAWAAKTFSEYLSHCAQTKAELLEAISSACTNDALEELIDQKSDQLTDDIDVAINGTIQVIQEAGGNYITADPGSEEYVQSYIDWIDTETGSEWWDEFTANHDLPEEYSDPEAPWNDNTSGKYSFMKYLRFRTYDDILSVDPDINSLIDDITADTLEEQEFDSDTEYPLNNGAVSMSDLFKAIIRNSNLNVTDATLSFDAKSMIDDTVVGKVEYTLDEFWNEAKANMCSTIAWAQGFAVCAKENVTDRLVAFENAISTFISDTQANFTSAISTVKTVLSETGGKVSSFVNQAEQLLGLTTVGDTEPVIANTDICKYTGASPYSDFDMHTIKGVAQATARVGSAVVKTIWSGVKKLASKAWKKFSPYVQNITDNPYDLKRISYTDSYTIANFCYDSSISDTWRYSSSAKLNTVYSIMSKKKDKWITYVNQFGECMFKLTNLSKSDTALAKTISFTLKYKFKPRAINSCLASEYQLTEWKVWDNVPNYMFIGTRPFTGTTLQDVYNFADYIKSFCDGEAFLPNDATEAEAYMGFLSATMLFSKVAVFGALESRYQNVGANFQPARSLQLTTEWYGTSEADGTTTLDIEGSLQQLANLMYQKGFASESGGSSPYPFLPKNISPSSAFDRQYKANTADLGRGGVTNLSFIKAASGYYNTGANPSFSVVPCEVAGVTTHGDWILDFGKAGILPLFMAAYDQWIDEYLHPTDYVYLPYSNDNYEFSDPRYEIKTDQENKNVVDIFVSIVTIVAIVAIAVIVGKHISKVYKQKKFVKFNQLKGVMDNAMWQGTNLPDGSSPLDRKNIKKYCRYTRKLDKINIAGAGLAGSASSAESIANLAHNISNSMTSSTDPDDYLKKSVSKLSVLIASRGL